MSCHDGPWNAVAGRRRRRRQEAWPQHMNDHVQEHPYTPQYVGRGQGYEQIPLGSTRGYGNGLACPPSGNPELDRAYGIHGNSASISYGVHQHRQLALSAWQHDGYQHSDTSAVVFARQHANQVHPDVAVVQPRTFDGCGTGVPQLNGSLDEPSVLCGFEQSDTFSSEHQYGQGWQPPMSQGSRPMEAPNIDSLSERRFEDSPTESHAQVSNHSVYEAVSITVDRDVDNMSERSLDLDEYTEGYQETLEELDPFVPSRRGALPDNREPWNSLNAAEYQSSPSSLGFDMHRLPDRIEMPTTSFSPSTGQTTESSYVMVNSLSSMTSVSQEPVNNMADSGLTICPQELHSPVAYDVRLQDGGDISEHLVPSLTYLNLISSSQNANFLSPPSRSGRSDATSTTGSCRSISEIIYCREPDCSASFGGEFRRGNYHRHKRNLHRGQVTIGCQWPGCGKAFRRTDARLKHYRKHHPELAADAIPRPERAKNNRPLQTQRPVLDDQEFMLFRVGSGLSEEPPRREH